MALHREEGMFSIRIDLLAEFPEDYEGEEDGYAWLERWRASVRPRLVKAVFDQLRSERGFEAVPSPRGASPADGVDIAVRFLPAHIKED
jgi:hypothetical protein